MEVFHYMELLSGHEKIITKSEISLNAGTLNRGFTVCLIWCIIVAFAWMDYRSPQKSSGC
jgi:hypothetical protein